MRTMNLDGTKDKPSAIFEAVQMVLDHALEMDNRLRRHGEIVGCNVDRAAINLASDMLLRRIVSPEEENPVAYAAEFCEADLVIFGRASDSIEDIEKDQERMKRWANEYYPSLIFAATTSNHAEEYSSMIALLEDKLRWATSDTT